MMEPKILEKPLLKVVGYNIPPKEGKEFHPYEDAALWFGADFSAVSLEDYKKLAEENRGEIGMWYHPEDKSGSLTYFFGPIVSSFDFIPPTMIPLELPAATYAVFTTNPVSTDNDVSLLQREIKTMWKFIYTKWLDASDYQWDEGKYAFEYYYDATGVHSGYSTADIYIPVVRK